MLLKPIEYGIFFPIAAPLSEFGDAILEADPSAKFRSEIHRSDASQSWLWKLAGIEPFPQRLTLYIETRLSIAELCEVARSPEIKAVLLAVKSEDLQKRIEAAA